MRLIAALGLECILRSIVGSMRSNANALDRSSCVIELINRGFDHLLVLLAF